MFKVCQDNSQFCTVVRRAHFPCAFPLMFLSFRFIFPPFYLNFHSIFFIAFHFPQVAVSFSFIFISFHVPLLSAFDYVPVMSFHFPLVSCSSVFPICWLVKRADKAALNPDRFVCFAFHLLPFSFQAPWFSFHVPFISFPFFIALRFLLCSCPFPFFHCQDKRFGRAALNSSSVHIPVISIHFLFISLHWPFILAYVSFVVLSFPFAFPFTFTSFTCVYLYVLLISFQCSFFLLFPFVSFMFLLSPFTFLSFPVVSVRFHFFTAKTAGKAAQ